MKTIQDFYKDIDEIASIVNERDLSNQQKIFKLSDFSVNWDNCSDMNIKLAIMIINLKLENVELRREIARLDEKIFWSE